ncbi:MAG TPA: ribonuclease M5 [Bacillales bacterium]|nr:ribonuclease M5 [Bacillales bacterium]HEU5140309.1 ribonuclease M5 [Bacillales bacterium]
MKMKEMIVVEGKSDTIAIRNAVQADTIETNGSAVSSETLEKIRLAQQRRGVIVLTDPDYPGQRIRNIISEQVPGCKHAFIPKEETIADNGASLGIEHASPEAIRRALSHVKQDMPDETEIISRNDLVNAGLIGGAKAKQRREKLGAILHIGYANGKQLHKRLQMFQITKEEFTEAYQQIEKEEHPSISSGNKRRRD